MRTVALVILGMFAIVGAVYVADHRQWIAIVLGGLVGVCLMKAEGK